MFDHGPSWLTLGRIVSIQIKQHGVGMGMIMGTQNMQIDHAAGR